MGLLGRARKMIRGWAPDEPPAPQYYNVACPEGHILRGIRTEGYQALRCPSCGEGVFVLPQSPLPQPPAPTSTPRRRVAAPQPVFDDSPIPLTDAPPQPADIDVEAEAEGEIVWLEPESAESPPAASSLRLSESEISPDYRRPPKPQGNPRPPSSPTSKRSVPRPQTPGRPASDGSAALSPRRVRRPSLEPSAAVEERVITVSRASAWDGLKRHRLALVILSVGLLVAVTVGYRIWLSRWENLPHVAEVNWVEGQEALERGHFDEAKQKLARAAKAFEQLGVKDERASKSRQFASESAIFADLVSKTLEELVDEAARYQPPEKWPERFETIYKGQSLILESTIAETPETSRSGMYELDYRIFVGRGPRPSREGRIDLKGFQLFESLAPKVGQNVLFGARLSSLRFEGGVWRVRFMPDSGVILTQLKALPYLTRHDLPPIPAQEGRGLGRSFIAAAMIALVPPLDGPVEVEPGQLVRRPDLIGREVAVDGRIQFFQLHPGRGFDEILFKESSVAFRLPPKLRFSRAPDARVVRAIGILHKEGDQFAVDVQSLQLLPEDEVRLAQGVAVLAPDDVKNRKAWARWAARRAEMYSDVSLEIKARELEAQVLRIEANDASARDPKTALALAREGRENKVPEPLPSSLAHRAFQGMARLATTPEELDQLASRIETFLPRSSRPVGTVDLNPWLDRYQADPMATYLQAPQNVRNALDRRLLADVRQRSLELKAKTDGSLALKLAEDARTQLPDRPELAETLRNLGLETASRNVAALRRSEVLDLARAYEKSGQSDRGREVIRSWLQDQRENRLGARDAEGRVLLADQYRSLLNDRTTAVALLREAVAIDPESKPASEAFRRLGFRQEGDQWVEAVSSPSGEEADRRENDPDAIPELDDPIVGLTTDEVLSRFGKPDRRSRSITQGQVMIQWTYVGSRGSTQYINFLQKPNLPATVISRYSRR